MSAASISAMASGSIVLTGAIVALETGTAAGVSMSWNPIGWTTLAIVAVAAVVVVSAVVIYHYWDDICDFFSSIGNSIVEGAKVVWEYVDSPPITVPPPAIDLTLPLTLALLSLDILLDEVETIIDTKPITSTRQKRRNKDIFNVYDLHIEEGGIYRNYTWGKGHKDETLRKGAIWKYGLTSFNSVYARYLIISTFFNSDKEEYIFRCISKKLFKAKEWYLKKRVNYAKANAKEVQLIEAYISRRCKLPPGNTFKG